MHTEETDACEAIALRPLVAILFFFQAAGASAQLNVDQCVRLALYHSPAPRVAAAETEAAGERVREARAAYRPQIKDSTVAVGVSIPRSRTAVAQH
jgi:outer membrane protein TolC